MIEVTRETGGILIAVGGPDAQQRAGYLCEVLTPKEALALAKQITAAAKRTPSYAKK